MKKILILILIISSVKLFAQHPDLQQEWYVQSVTTNNITTAIPSDPIELPYVYLTFFSTTSGLVGSENAIRFYSNNCNIGFTGHVSHSGTTIFEFTDFNIFQYITNCNTNIIDFMNLYVNFYNDEITEQFTYSITTETDNSKTLLVTNNNGDTIIYTNKFFNTPPQEIADRIWYLHNLVINGVDNVPPNNSEITNIRLEFNGNGNTTYACSYITSQNYFDYNTSQFYSYISVTNFGLTFCSLTSFPENNTFTDLYIRDFYLHNLPGPFNYEHVINGNNETLTITNSQGNQAIYRNTILSTPKINKEQFSIYPNPVKNILHIKNESIDIKEITIFDILGKEVLKTSQTTIDVSAFSNGLYIFKIKTSDNTIVTKKIMKVGK